MAVLGEFVVVVLIGLGVYWMLQNVQINTSTKSESENKNDE